LVKREKGSRKGKKIRNRERREGEEGVIVGK
jgi:hypothetical protein